VQHSRGNIPTIPTIREIITKDCLSIRQKSTIIDAMPEEYKQKEKVEYGKEGRQKQLEQAGSGQSTEFADQGESSNILREKVSQKKAPLAQ
jgi:hypothetical protein